MELCTQDFTLRSARKADYDVIAEIWHKSASLPTVGPPLMPSLSELRARVDLGFANGWHVTLAERGDNILGFVATIAAASTLNELFVRPEFLGLGIGHVLLAQAKAEMPDGFTLFTATANARARHFYEKAGLKNLRDDAHPRSGNPVTYYGWKRDRV